MRAKFLMPAAVALSIAVPAVAATTSGSTSSATTPSVKQQQNADQPPTPRIADKLRNSLAQAGFTDVHVMPQSFLVRARDQDGNPVMMVLNPDSMTAVTALGPAGRNANSGAGNGTVGSGSSDMSPSNQKP